MIQNQIPGVVLREHRFEVPLDHARPDGPTIELFAREARAPEPGAEERPWLVFFQGGPGYGAPRPMGPGGWVGRAIRDYRVLLLDERGTGGSSPISARGLERLASVDEQADYLGHFRADSIARDAECVRRRLLGDDGRWTVLGQSFGGFCVTAYLSIAPDHLDGAILTGGLPSLDGSADDVYRETYPILIRKNEAYYRRYPEDVERVARVAEHLASRDVRLPDGDRLTVRRLQLLGLHLGMSDGFEVLHYLFEAPFVEGPDGTELAWTFLRGVQNALTYDTNPIFSVLHEACYTQGAASRWSAERLRGEHAGLDPGRRDPLMFTGEMIYPWMFEEIGALRSLGPVARRLAEREDWPRLYAPDVLARNTVPVAASVYVDDMYVPRRLSSETATRIANIRVWETNEYEHNGLRADGERVLDKLLEMLRGGR